MPSPEKLAEFVAWAKKNITGDEKGQAQIFLDRLFQAIGRPGSLDVGGQPEFRVRKAGEDGGGTAFADDVGKPVVLIEMKKRSEPVTAPGIPPGYPHPSRLVTHDCIRPALP